MSDPIQKHRSLGEILASVLGITAAVQAANADQLAGMQSQIHDLKVEIDSHPEISTTTSQNAAAVLDNAAAQPPETVVAAPVVADAAPETADAPTSDTETQPDAAS